MPDGIAYPNERRSRSSAKATVLVVDDTLANLVALQALVGTLGCEVVTADSGARALEQVRERDFAVILLDVMMPDLDGFDTLQRLRALPEGRTTPVIFMTAQSVERRSLERAYALGAVDYISKPIEPPILLGKVRAFMALFEQAQEIRRQADALRAKDRYLGVLAHDLRTPLSVVGMTAVQLEQSDDPAIRAAAARLARAALRMQSLSDDLLETARMALGALRFRPEPLDLRELLSDLLTDFEALHPQVSFQRLLPDALPLRGDRLRLQQAMTNLLTNAVKYGTGWATLRVVAEAQHVRIELVNESREILPEQLEQLFEPFAQGRTHSDGVGLGLYIVREIARLHGGSAHAYWRDGQVTFVIELAREVGGRPSVGQGPSAASAPHDTN